MQAGQNPSDPLTLLNSHMGHGLMAGFNPFEGLGVNPNDPNMVRWLCNINLDRDHNFHLVPRHDGFPTVSSTDVQPHVQPCYRRSNYCFKPESAKHGPSDPTSLSV